MPETPVGITYLINESRFLLLSYLQKQPVAIPRNLLIFSVYMGLTDMPASLTNVFALMGLLSLKLKMLEHAIADALPRRIPSTRSCNVPTPPHAITGIDMLFATDFISSRSYPSIVPSLSMDVRKISPAFNSSTRFAQSTGSRKANVGRGRAS